MWPSVAAFEEASPFAAVGQVEVQQRVVVAVEYSYATIRQMIQTGGRHCARSVSRNIAETSRSALHPPVRLEGAYDRLNAVVDLSLVKMFEILLPTVSR